MWVIVILENFMFQGHQGQITSNLTNCENYQIWIIRGSFDIPIKWHLRFCKKKLKSGQFWPCYSQKCKNRKLLRRVTNFFQIFTKLWKFLSYSLFDYRKIVKSWLFGRAIQKPEVLLLIFLLFYIWIIASYLSIF